MIRIRGALLPEHVLLGLIAQTREGALQLLCESLRSDTRISDWESFLRDLRKYEAAGKVNLQYSLTLRHIRTSAVTGMLMAFGRLTRPLQEQDGPLQFVVLVGIPLTMDADYLRLVGTLMRVFRSEKLRGTMLRAQNPLEVIHILERGETGME
ncbi:MAG: PTS sugar transporter subunit IIA [Verrucomicrobia bacterium]|nr:PTS sugar transporter subunit IIA [Verrucomicrobiota bacterium]